MMDLLIFQRLVMIKIQMEIH